VTVWPWTHVAVGYLLGGYVVFHYATRRARRLGVLGDY